MALALTWDSDSVSVLGAGVTKAFLPKAPLLVDDYNGQALKEQFSSFLLARALLESELANPDHPPGFINLERLMTRLAGGMPYDFATGAEKSFAAPLYEVQQSLLRRLREARQGRSAHPGELWLFAGLCVRNVVNCSTFTYDDVLD